MILVLTKDRLLARDLIAELMKRKLVCEALDSSDPDSLQELFQPRVRIVILDSDLAGLPTRFSEAIINGLARRSLVIVLGRPEKKSSTAGFGRHPETAVSC